MKIRYLELS